MTENEIIIKIKKHELGNKNEAYPLYSSLCHLLQEKYGCVDKDYDEKPTMRGKEWIDIHHIKEYELDDITKRTNKAIKEENYDLLQNLKPYNVKEQLVYANKIEHFLLHYLIDSIRGQDIFSGGPNFLWDCCVALDIYGFKLEFMNNLQTEREKLYSLMTSEEITLLYKKLIDWKNWNTQECSEYWKTYKSVLKQLYCDEVSYVFDKDKFFKLFGILGHRLNVEKINAIKKLPYKVRTVELKDGTINKIIYGHFFKEDEETVAMFNYIDKQKSFTIPYYVKGLAVGAFNRAYRLETITIPTTVQRIEDNTFVTHETKVLRFAEITKIIYKGTKEKWNEKFSNVILNNIKLVCKKY